MSGNSHPFQSRHQMGGNPVIQNTFAGDNIVLGAVSSRRIILEILDDCPGLRALENCLCLSFVQHLSAIGQATGKKHL